MDYSEFLRHLLGGSVFSLAIFAILVFLSVIGWGIGIAKFIKFSSLVKSNRQFRAKHKPFLQNKVHSSEFRYKGSSPLYHIHYLLMNTYQKTLQRGEEKANKEELTNLLDAKLNSITIRIADEMESGVSLLATISNTAPFIGLLGTVLGVTFSFQSIGLQGSTNLAVVAPGISEALIATALGLFAAIPASFFYNYSRSRIRKIKNETYLFGQDLIAFIVYQS